jgi:hypothetical protein
VRLVPNRRVWLLALVAAIAGLLAARHALAGATALILPTHTAGVHYSKVRQATISKSWHLEVCNGTLTLRQAEELAYKRKHG